MGLIAFVLALVALRPKVADKLIDTVAKAFPPTFGPALTAINSHFEAHGALIKSRADTTALVARLAALREQNVSPADVALLKLIDASPEASLKALSGDDPILNFSRSENERRVTNRLRITAAAVTALPEEVSDEAVDPDFIHRFFRNSEDVSNVLMQSLWGKILAGEISKPGTFSPRTIEALRSVNQREAEIFTRYCSLVWDINGEKVAIRRNHIHIGEITAPLNLNLRDLRQLDYAGLVHLGTLVPFEFGAGTVFKYFDIYRLTTVRKGQVFTSPLTLVGEELFPLCGATPLPEYGSNIHATLENFCRD